MVSLDANGSSEVFDHSEYAIDVDNFNILALIPFVGLRVPLKCYRAWAAFARRQKLARHKQVLRVRALHLRPRAIRVLSRVVALLSEAEEAALNGELPLLPSDEVRPTSPSILLEGPPSLFPP